RQVQVLLEEQRTLVAGAQADGRPQPVAVVPEREQVRQEAAQLRVVAGTVDVGDEALDLRAARISGVDAFASDPGAGGLAECRSVHARHAGAARLPDD